MNRPINMPPQYSDTYLLASSSGIAGHARLAEKVDDRAAHRDLAADIHEDGEHAQHDVRILERADAALDLAFADVRQVDEPEHRRQQHEDDAEPQVRHLHRLRAVRAGLGEVLEDQVAADERADGGADRIEALRQVQPARRGSLRAQDRDVGIGRDLQHREADADDEQRRQEQRIGVRARRRPEQRAAGRRDQQAETTPFL